MEARAKPQTTLEFNDVAMSLNSMLDVMQDREKIIKNMALTDELTGLANRNLFHKELLTALNISERTKIPVALILLDLDKFKPINDTYGHQAGDHVLREISSRLLQITRKMDTVARLGGDEFAIILTNHENTDTIASVAKRILAAMGEPIVYKNKTLTVGISLGIAIFPDDAADPEELIQKSDLALYQVKNAGRGDYHFYDTVLDAAVTKTRTIEKYLRQALDKDEFTLNFQPIFDLQTATMSCVETLIRWEHPIRGIIPPIEFIPTAESSRLIGSIDRWVLKESCRQNYNWQKSGFEPFKITVNISSQLMNSANFPETVGEILASTGLEPRWLAIEITEKSAMNESSAFLDNAQELGAMGVDMSIVDFGTGLSSISRLNNLPVRILKIDKYLVDNIHIDPKNKMITEAIVRMTHKLNLKTVAIGVECVEQEAVLKSINCDQVQGYLYCKPISATNFELWLEARQPKLSQIG